jgi:predicted small metal-binding protein
LKSFAIPSSVFDYQNFGACPRLEQIEEGTFRMDTEAGFQICARVSFGCAWKIISSRPETITRETWIVMKSTQGLRERDENAQELT